MRPVVAVGIDWERQSFDTGSISTSYKNIGILVAGALQIKPEGRVFGIPLLGDIGIVRTLFHDDDVTEIRGRLHILLTPSIVRGDDDGD